MKGSPTNKKKHREQYDVSISGGKYKEASGYNPDPAVVVALVFGGQATIEAERLLDEFGLLALKEDNVTHKSMVRLHHIEGYKYGETEEEVRENRAYNCDISKTKFVVDEAHTFLTSIPSADATNEKHLDYMVKHLSDLKKANDSTVTMYLSDGKNAGDIKEGVQFYKDDDGNCRAIANDGSEVIIDSLGYGIMIPNTDEEYVGYIRDEKGREIERDELGEKVYDDLVKYYHENFESIYKKYGWKPFPIGIVKKSKDGENIVERKVYISIGIAKKQV